MSSRLRRAGPGILFAALVLLVYADPLLTRRNFSGRDLIAYNLPMEKSIHDAYASGRLPVWAAEISGGRPLLPNPNAGALYPVRALLAPLPFPLSSRIFPVLHWALAGLGVLALAFRTGRSRAAGWIGAATYAFSGVAVSEVFFPHIQPGMALLPWIVWATASPSSASARRVLVLGLLFALDLLAADVFTSVLAIGAAALWILLESPAPARPKELALLSGSVGLGALAAAPQILATALWIPHTNRAVLGIKLADAIHFSIHPLRLLELVVPYPFGASWDMTNGSLWGWPLFRGHSLGIFNTLFCGSLAVVAVASTWRSREPGGRFARVLLFGALAIAVPPALLPMGWSAGVRSPLPLRNPEKLAVAIVFALSVLVSLAVDQFRRGEVRRRWTLGVGVLLTLLSLAAAEFPAASARLAVGMIGADPVLGVPRARASLSGSLAEAGLLWMATIVAIDLLARPRRGPLIAALVLLTAVPLAADRRIARSFLQEEVFAPTAFARRIAREDPDRSYRTLGESLFVGPSRLGDAAMDSTLVFSEFSRRTWTQHTQALWGRGTVINEDFDVGDLSRVESLRQLSGMATGFKDSESFFGSLALRWGIRFKDQKPVAGYVRFGGDALQDWDEHRRSFPDIRLVGRWAETPGALAALHTISSLRDGDIVVESGRARVGAARAGAVRILERSAERLRLEVDAPDPAWLFVLRAHWPYRAILLDGSPVEAAPAQLAFCAVPIPAGRHRIDWRERVPGLGLSGWGPVLFGMIAVGLAVSKGRRRIPS